MKYDPKARLPEVTWRKLDVPEPKPGDVHEALRFAVYIGLRGACAPEDQDGIVEGVMDALIANLPGEWAEIEDWMRAVKDGSA